MRHHALARAQINSQLSPRRARPVAPPRRVGRAGVGDPPQGLPNLQQYFTQQGSNYVLNEASSITGYSPQQISTIVSLCEQGKVGEAFIYAFEAGLTIYGGPIGAAAAALIAGIQQAYANDYPKPCTIPGCESTFGLPSCAGGINPFTWDAIGNAVGPYVPPQGNIPDYQFGSGGAGYGGGRASLLDWGNPNWLCDFPSHIPSPGERWSPPLQCHASAGADPMRRGGPGSFEQVFEYGMMDVWDRIVSSPHICQALKENGSDGNIGWVGNAVNGGTSPLQQSIPNMAMIAVGLALPAFVHAWNQTHTTGDPVQVPCTSCPPNSQGPSNGECYSNATGYWTKCTGPAPQRMVSYTVGPATDWADPIQAAFSGLAQLGNVPEGSTLSILINGGPPVSANIIKMPPTLLHGGPPPGNFASKPASSMGTTEKTVLGAVVVAAAAALGTYGYARYKHKSYKSVWQGIWKRTGGRVRVPKQIKQLPKSIKKLGKGR